MVILVVCDLFQGTQSLNPHNDYCQHFVDTGHRPQNFIRDVGKCYCFNLVYIQFPACLREIDYIKIV